MSGQSESIAKLSEALAAAQAEIEGAARDRTNPHLKNTYADLASVWDACREALTRRGLAVVQRGVRDGDGWALETVLAHASGEWVSGLVPLVYGPARGTSEMQAVGSAWTYARRYGLAALVGVVAEDDDGEAAGARPRAEPRDRRPGRRGDQERSDEGPLPSPAPRPAAKRVPWESVLARALGAWAKFDPPEPTDQARRSREHRIAHDLVSAALDPQDRAAAELGLDRPLLDGNRVYKPAEAGKESKRDPAKVWAAVRWLYQQHPAWVKRVIRLHLDRLAREALGPGAEGDEDLSRAEAMAN